MARPSNTAERRRQISDALVRVMSRHGYHEASIARVAKEAGLAAGLVLYHFDSKAAILLEVVEAMVGALERRYRERRARAADTPRAHLHAFIDAHLALGDGADEAAVAAWVVIGAEAVRDPEVRNIYARSVQSRLRELESLIRADLRASGAAGKGVPRIAAAVLAAVEGSFVLAVAAPGVLPRGYAAPAVRAMVDGLLA